MNHKFSWTGILIISLIALFTPDSLPAQTVVINEMMASNATTIADEDGDYEDWIELYNAGNEIISLGGWGLSDDYNNPYKWVFPGISLKPGSFLLVWASGKNRSDPQSPLHSNFSIRAAGEEVLITHPSGNLIDALAPLPLPADISYGRQPDAAPEWCYFDAPTPGESNVTSGYEQWLATPEIIFTQNETGQVVLSLTHPDEEANLYYTLDGNEPDETTFLFESSHVFDSLPSCTLMFIRTTPLEADPYGFGWNSPKGEFPQTLVIRTRAYKPNCLPSPVKTKSHLSETFDLPVVSIATSTRHLFSDSTGIYVPGMIYQELGWNDDDYFGFPNANYWQSGPEWERPANMEFHYPDGSYHTQACGIRLHGGRSRVAPMKSIRLYARSQYGPNTIDFDIFEDGMTDYRRLILRNSGQDFYVRTTLFRDALIHTLTEGLGFDFQKYQPVQLFINGAFWGIHNLRERLDKHYFAQHYGLDEDNIDLLENYWLEVAEGDNFHFHQNIQYIEDFGLEEETHYDSIQKRIDVDNYLNYQIAQVYINNTDWPGNNMKFWRYRTDGYLPDAPQGQDGRWRWLLYDTDFAFGLSGGHDAAEHNMLEFATTTEGTTWANPPAATWMLRQFLVNEQFKIRFINRFADLLNTYFSEDRVVAVIDSLQDQIAGTMPLHTNRWGYPASMESWQNNVSLMRQFAFERPDHQRQHLMSYFDIDELINANLNTSGAAHGHIRINTIEISGATPGVSSRPYPWTGYYFKDIPIELEAIPANGYYFSHWEGFPDSNAATISLTPEDDFELTAHFIPYDTIFLMYFWVFDKSMPNDSPLENIEPAYAVTENAMLAFQSSMDGYPFYEGHPNWRKASMERCNAPTALNYYESGNQNLAYEDAGMRGLQVRQPFQADAGENTLYFEVPSTGYKNLIFRFAAKDEGAAESLVMEYTTQQDHSFWSDEDISTTITDLTDEYQLFEYDFSAVQNANNDPDLSLRIRFEGADMTADHGNRVTFNNFSLQGEQLTGLDEPIDSQKLMLEQNFPNPFSQTTQIVYELPENGFVQLSVINAMGKPVASLVNKFQYQGRQRILFQADDFSSGFYLIRLTQNGQNAYRKMLIIK